MRVTKIITIMIRTIRMRIMKMNMRMNFNIIDDQGQ